MLTALGSTSQTFLYLHAEWAETSNLTAGIFDFHFQIGDMVQFVSLYVSSGEAILLQ